MTDRPSPLDILEAVYLNEELPLTVRMRAAIESAPYRHPKLSAMAHAAMTGQDFAAMLDRAIQRTLAGPPPKLIEAIEMDEECR